MRRKLAGCAVLTLVGAAAVAAAAPAAASTATSLPLPLGPTVAYEVETTTYDDVGPGQSKEVTASCQDGKKLIGVGYSRSGGGSGVVIHQALPEVNRGPGLDDRVTVKAYETAAGTPNPWSLSAKAYCASGLSNVEVVDVSAGPDRRTPKDVVAPCPFAKEVVGTSFVASGGPGEVMVTEVNPIAVSDGDDSVRVTAHADDDGIVGKWGVTAYAFCATAPFGLTIVSHTENLPTDDDDIDDAVSCPDGKVSLGGGVYLGDVNGVSAGNLMLTHLSVGGPISTGDYIASAGAREDADGTPADWELTVKVVCAAA